MLEKRKENMNKNFNPPISIEKIAAFLDGNLPDEETNKIESLVSEDKQLFNLVEECNYIDSEIDAYGTTPTNVEPFDFMAIDIPEVLIGNENFSCASQLDDIHTHNLSMFHDRHDDYGEPDNGLDSCDGNTIDNIYDNDYFQL